MSSMYFLIPLSLGLLLVALLVFVWATRRGQYDDLQTPAWKILLDDDRRPPAAPDATDDEH